jgi:protein arginine kinase
MGDNAQSNQEILRLKKPWQHNQNSIWLASSVSLKRNIEKFKFPGKLDVERKKQIVSLVGREHLTLDQLSHPTLIKAENLNFLDKEYLVEHFFTISDFHQTGIGEAFIIDDSGELVTVLNLSDHIAFYIIDGKEDIEGAWNKLMKIETALGKNLAYSFSRKFGFLTSSLGECGTALQVTTYLQLPALLHLGKIDEILEKEADESYLIMGIQGSPSEIIGDVFAIQNAYTLGITEENILSSIRTLTTKLMTEENAARKSIEMTQNTMIIDKVSRSFGILLYSYQIEAIEALNAISLCKLGVSMGWVSGITEGELNQLFFNCRRAHLLGQFNEKVTQEEISHKRAEYIHKALKNAKLLV